MKKLYNRHDIVARSEADISLKLWNKKVSDYNLTSSSKNEDEPAPLFDTNAVLRENDAQFCLNDYYKISANRRSKRTMYSQTFVDSFASDSFYDKLKTSSKNLDKDSLLLDKTLKETRIKSWFDSPCYQFNASDRLNQLLKSKTNKHSVEDRYKMYQRSNDYKLHKANNNSSINAIESLAKRNSALIQDFKKKYG